ncbi:hypothetical protein J7I94_34295 [Streptomyces sp. ISL-12]|uniref:hypothetical protein n=1 Tax=Streptomyces sp. ISL-12 TaxID=2819177 RepID=UPI001BECC207|nr:hypothetical protein [Streptomyces sp. ISL-12]MBT2415545.1 hypothetical protein [Streptomyces sp. ISL-12]
MNQQYPQQPNQPQQPPQQPNQPPQRQAPYPQQPGWGGPQTPPGAVPGAAPGPGYGYGAPVPQPPKKSSAGKIVGLGCAGLFALFVVIGLIGAAVSGGDDDSADASTKDKAVVADEKPKGEQSAETAGEEETAAEEATEAAETTSQAEQFQACVAKNGTATEKTAIEHVTKVTGTDQRNDILDTAEVFTDYTGGLLGPHQGDGKLIASAFTSCYESDNGLVTVYDKDGEILANANY